ncbi:MAG: tRNA epoxyqueuosine(34) reductase QueG [Firmicutes bacterium]|nr:tRNA epoxyqueuosine(34) reductase QueG [Bacillota bacterium]
MNAGEQTAWIVRRARTLGFDLCGVSSVEAYRAEASHLEQWLARGFAGQMRYLQDPRRRDPELVLPGARSIVVCALNYNTDLPYSTEVLPDDEVPRGWISRYAWGADYHHVLGQRLEALLEAMRAHLPVPFAARWYVDTGPVVERIAARCAGLGWLAKNTCLIHEGLGSWLFLGVILTTLELASTQPAEGPPPDQCGQCTLCIEACPTAALVAPYLLDPRRCISYLTIELRGEIPEEFRAAVGRHIFGCDLCQDVCPWNRKAPVTPLAEWAPRELSVADGAEPRSLFSPELDWLLGLTEAEFRALFRRSAIRRARWQGLLRNVCVALGNWLARRRPGSASSRPGSESDAVVQRVVALLERLAGSEDPVIAVQARHALRGHPPPEG